MARVQVQDPFNGGASLRPTIQPQTTTAGVARPTARQDIFAVADALGEFNPEIRGMLREEQAKAQNDAMTAGELKAAELSAKERMDTINGKLKTYVDNGTIPKAQLPYFQRGFNRRTGRELALNEFQLALDNAYKQTVAVEGRADPEAVLASTLKTFREQLPQGDVYAAKGFDEVAAQVSQQFRQRSNAEYRRNYEQAAEVKIADEGIDLLQQHVLADVDAKDTTLASFRDYFTRLKETELPKSEVAPFIVKNAVSPMVEDLVARGDFDGAEELVETMESFDVTGQGGLLGNMSTTKGQLAQLKLNIAERRRRADDPTETFQKKTNAAYFKGNADAKVALVELGDGVLTAPVKAKLLSDYREQNRDNPWAVSAYADYLDKTYREGVTQDDPDVVAGIARLAESTSTAELDRAFAALEAGDAANTISPATRLKLEDRINKSRALFGLITEEDTRFAERTIYRAEVDDLSRQVLPVFGTAEQYLSETLTREQRLAHRQGTMQFYRDSLAAKLRNGTFANAEAAQAELPKLRAEALNEAIAYADKLTATFLPKENADAGPKAAPAQGGSKPREKKAPTPQQPDPLAGVVTATPEEKSNDPDRNRSAFLSFFAEPFQEAAPWPSSGRLQGLTPTLKDTGKFFPAAERMSDADAAAYQERLRPALVYKAVKTDYLKLVKYRERGSDAGDPNYIKRLRELATNLKTYGGAEYLTAEQLTNLGLNPAAFPTAGTKAGLIQ
jgi:hypothetical protein